MNLTLPGFTGNYPLLHPLGHSYCVDEARFVRIIIRNSSTSTYDNSRRAVVDSLVSSKTKLRSATVDSELLAAFSSYNQSLWRRLQLDQLRKLTVTSPDFWDELHVPGRSNRDNRISRTMSAILSKCPSGLQHFEFERTTDVPRIPTPIFHHWSLRSIRTLSLEAPVVQVVEFAKDVSEVAALRSIYVRDCKLQPNMKDWVPLLHAVHDHTKPLSLALNELWTKRGCEDFSVNYPDIDPNTYVQCIEGVYVHDELFVYLANRGPWTDELEAEHA